MLYNEQLAIKRGHSTISGEIITLYVPAHLFGGRTLVPVRAVAESFGAKVNWDEESGQK